VKNRVGLELTNSFIRKRQQSVLLLRCQIKELVSSKPTRFFTKIQGLKTKVEA